MKNKNKKSKKNWLVFFILGGFLLKLLFNLKKERVKDLKINFLDYVEKEEKEVKKLVNKKETLKEFEEDSCSLFRQYFVPCDVNHFHPKLLETRSLVLVLILLMVLKIAVAGYLFFVYPNKGNMAVPGRVEILSLINADRKKLNLPLLTFNSELNKAAGEKLNDMAAKNYFAHNSPDGKKPWDWINRGNYHYTLAGENLAMDFTTAQAVHKALMESISHRKNILNQKFENVGIAMAEKTIDGEKTNILVEFFGAQKEIEIVKQKVAEAKTNNVILASVNTSKQINHLPIIANKTPVKVSKAFEDIKTNKTAETAVVAGENFDPEKQGKIELAVISEISERNISPRLNVVAVEKNDSSRTAKNIIQGTQYFYLLVFLALVLVLSVNILIKLSVQHKPVLVETLFTIFIIIGFITTQTGYLEKLIDKVVVF